MPENPPLYSCDPNSLRLLLALSSFMWDMTSRKGPSWHKGTQTDKKDFKQINKKKNNDMILDQ